MEIKGHKIKEVLGDSIAQEMGIEAGDYLIDINGQPMGDAFDYHYFVADEYLEIGIMKADGEAWILEVEKEYNEDLGIVFESSLMDDYKSCRNKCIFCFIDQLPLGMRETLYFKDDDSRLSFLQGNYITLTNIKEEDVNRIIQYKLSPINVSVHTTNPALRVKMLKNRFAGKILDYMRRFYEAGIIMNGQIVLCKGVNDGVELERSIRELGLFIPHLQSVSVVPVGLSKHREGLYPLEPFTKEDARETLEIIHRWQDIFYKQYGTHFIHAGDEIYLLAELPIPEEENYDGYLQIENGVGMMRSTENDFMEVYKNIRGDERTKALTVVTGMLAFSFTKKLMDLLMDKFPNVKIQVIPIRNDFFGERITVSGLLTGQDIINQLSGIDLKDILLLPGNLLRSGEDVLLDDVRIQDIEKALQVKIGIVKSTGKEFIESVIGDVIIE